jgi:hypothetical protein
VAQCPYRVGVPRDGLAGPRACSVPGGGTDAVQSASLTCPSLSSGFPPDLVLPPQGRSQCYLDHVQHTTNEAVVQKYPTRAPKVRYKIEVAGCNNPWAASMRTYMPRLLGTGSLGAKTLELLTAACAKSTSDTYNNAIKPYVQLCEEHDLPPLAATAATMAHDIAWPTTAVV